MLYVLALETQDVHFKTLNAWDPIRKMIQGTIPLCGAPVLRHICIFSEINNIFGGNVRNALFMKQDK